MKTPLSVPFLLLAFSQLQAQPATTHSLHFNQNGFVQNEGQFSDEHGRPSNQVTYLYAKDDFHIALNSSGFSYELIQETPDVKNFPESGFTDPEELQDWRDAQTLKASSCRMDITLKGANPHPVIFTDKNTGTLYNYYLGKLAVVNVPAFNRITYKNIYPGIDLVFEDHQGENGNAPEYSFIVHPGADAHLIKMKYSGAGNVSLADQHTLSIAMPYGFIKETGLRGYWQEDGSASDVSFRLKNGMLSFNIPVDKNKTLIIDPSIVWGSYFGGKGSENWDTESEIGLDHNNNVFLTGSTTSSKYIATTGAVMQTYGGGRDIFLAKFSLDGKQVLWGTYFGGSGEDCAYGVGCDSHNNVVITGFTKSPNIITTPGAFQDTLLGTSDAVIAQFSTTGQLIWSTLMGGPDDFQAEHGRSIIIDVHDYIYICGYSTATSNISTPGAYQVNKRADGDAFLVKFSQNGTKIWGTYFGGGGKDRAHALCFDPFGHIYFIGTTKSKKFIAMNGFQLVYGGNEDAFIAKFDTVGHFYWSSYYGGANGDRGRGIKCDGVGCVYFDGWTNSAGAISTPNGFQTTIGGGQDGFLAKFTPTGSRIWGTYFGGNAAEIFYGMAIDPQANIYVCGNTFSGSGIATPGALQTTFGGVQDALMVKFDSAGHRTWATYFGGTGIDDSYDIERDSAGMIYLEVDTRGPLPVSPDAYQTIIRGQDDLGVFEFNLNPPCPDNNEPNESFQSPHIITDPITPAGTSVSGAIYTAIDQDWFSVQLNSLTSIIITLTGLSKNYDLNVYNSNNVLIASSTNAGTAGEMVALSNVSGTFMIQITHDSLNFDQYNCYLLHIATDTTSGNFPAKLLGTISSTAIHHLKIYPNPSSGLMTAEFESNQKSDMVITAFDALGRIVFSQVKQATEGMNTFSIDLSKLNSGVYMLQVKGDDVGSILKITIEK